MKTSALFAVVLAVFLTIWLAPGARSQTTTSARSAPGVAPPTTEVPRDGCVTSECHASIKKNRYVHGPVGVNACDSCHRLTDASTHTFVLVRDRDKMCNFCHVVDVSEDSFQHEPFREGACLACHDPHGSAEPAMLRGAKYADLCYSCHKDVAAVHRFVHGPVSAGACGACHQPHAAKNRMLLAMEGRTMCLRCHVTTGIEIDTRRHVHDPVRADCEVCHNPHATDYQDVLNSDPVDLCTSCHEDIAHTLQTATTQHAAVTTQRSCLNCHEAHATDFPDMLKNTPKELCFECHDKEIEMPDGSKLENIKKIIETGKSLHGAIAQRSCVACHKIHGGSYRRLLTNEYPTDLYYPFSENAYALCFSCHDKDLVLLERTTAVTGFRNGDLNLHYVHVNRDKKGRTCNICHDAHAANRERHIRDTVPFGPKGWPLPIGYEKLPNGGKCLAGCHRAFEYNRVNPVTYPAEEEGEQWKGTDLVPGQRAEPPGKKE